MKAEDRAEAILQFVLQEQQAIPTKEIRDWITGKILEAEKEAVETSVNTFSLTKQEVDRCFQAGWAAAREQAAKIAFSWSCSTQSEDQYLEGRYNAADGIGQSISVMEPGPKILEG